MATTNETSPKYVLDEFDDMIRVYIDDHGRQGIEVAMFYDYATALAFIKAANAHDDLVGALSFLRSELSSYMGIVTVDEDEWSELWAALALVNTALAKAEGA